MFQQHPFNEKGLIDSGIPPVSLGDHLCLEDVG